MPDHPLMKSLHLFAGAGGGVIADQALGHTPVCLVEWDKDAQAVLRKRFPNVPVHGDVSTFSGHPWAGHVDLICGGWPCQSISVAGKQEGMSKGSGTRSALAFEFVRVVEEVRPRYVFAENVANVISPRHRGDLDVMLSDLTALGYGGVWCILSAAQVGYPHLRKRFWLLAEQGQLGWSVVGTTGSDAADLWPTPRVSGRGTVEFVRADGKLRDDLETTTFMGGTWPTPTVQDGCNTAGASQFARNTLPLNAEVFRDEVSKLTADQIRAIIGDRRLNARWVEQLMGWPVGWCDLDDDMPLTLPAPAGRHAEQYDHEAPRITSMPLRSAAAKRNNTALRQLGNGQVPACAATAFNLLMKHL